MTTQNQDENTSKVIGIKPETVVGQNLLKQQMLDYMAKSFDDMAFDFAAQPVAFVFALTTASGDCRAGWFIDDAHNDKTGMLANRGVAMLQYEMFKQQELADTKGLPGNSGGPAA